MPIDGMVGFAEVPSLFDETKDIVIIGARLSGEPEIVHEIEDYMRATSDYPIVRDQIKLILTFVPLVFPKDWKSPEGFDEMTDRQQKAFMVIHEAGTRLGQLTGPVIQEVIERALILQSADAHKSKSAGKTKSKA